MDWEAFYSRFREPDFIPGYEIQNRLGGGAFGEVYKARKHSIGKAYAIKFLKIEDDEQRAAVERELEQVRHFAALDHPNLVTIEDMGTALGVPYLIMGYAGEDTLARRLKHKGLAREEALLFFVQACRGVLALHDRRLVHFDIKPSNVFLRGDAARVGDYGLSKMLTDGRLTLSFGRGTPHYMAPEMMRGRADHRADVYSLGVLLYECLTGRLPFVEGDDPASSGVLLLREEDGPPAFPADVPPALRAAIERCLRVRPEDRYGNVGDLLADLGQTARPGDSIRFAPRVAEPSAAGVVPAPGARAKRDAPSSEARETAAHLARGAVEVARGVLDGLRGERRATRPLAGAPTPLHGTGHGTNGDAALNGLPPLTARGRQEAGLRDAPREGSVPLAIVGLSEGARQAPPPPEPPPGGGATFAAAGGGTIPVPPRVAGGPIGALSSTCVLAFEVMVALLGGVLRQLGRGFGRAGDRALRSVRGWVGAGLRLALFMALLFVLGGAVTLVGLLLLAGVGP